MQPVDSKVSELETPTFDFEVREILSGEALSGRGENMVIDKGIQCQIVNNNISNGSNAQKI